jgi:hypothetical protein
MLLLAAVGALTAAAVVFQLAAALPGVANRHALTYDAARRAMVDVDAADALRRGDWGQLLWDVAGPEQWPTLRLLVAAPAHALSGPARALGVELGVSIAGVGLLVLALSLSAAALAARPFDALGMFAVSCPLLLGNSDLLLHAANGMLEVPQAVFTLGATVAWTRARETGAERPWLLAVLGNALFHLKFQHGLFFSLAVLATEALGPGWRDRLRCVGTALARAARRPWGIVVLALGLGATVLSVGLVQGGGIHWSLLGHPVSLGRPRVVRWAAAASAFGFVSLAFAAERARLRATLPARLRFAWAWLLTPMAVWLLVPFTWRLETLVTSTTFDAGVGSLGFVDRLLFYPRADWAGWFPGPTAWVALALLAGTAAVAATHPGLRARLVPLGAVAGIELAALTLLAGQNLQPRFSVNLAPLVALAAALWIPEVRRPVPRAALAVAAAATVLAGVLPAWTRPSLAGVMARGFETQENGDACREVARALPFARGELVNETHSSRLQLCNLWVKFLARERGDEVLVREHWTAAGPHTVLLLTDGTSPPGPREGWTTLGPEARVGAVEGRLFRVDRSAPARLGPN